MRGDFHKQKTLPDLTSDHHAPPLPSRIGPYRIESLLNKGGMSYLYLALHPNTAQPIVVKVLSPKHCKNREIASRFLKEAQIIGITDHPNIVKLYGQGTWERGLYIAMEFIQGISLRQFIQQKSLSHRRALEIVLQVAYALCHLHSHGVIHRDLKPENILITESGQVKVIDFGIAQLQDEAVDERTTQTRRMMGTPIYMSPEQKENPLSVTYASDLYSLGIIAYELVLGRLSHGVIHLALLPPPLRAVIDTALQPNPAQRYQDIVDFITDVSQYLKTLQDSSHEMSSPVSDEALTLIQHTRTLLIPRKAPRWPPVEIGIAVREGPSPQHDFYYDFFRLPQERFCAVIAEPLAPSRGLLACAALRGMLRMAITQSTLSEKGDLHPVTLLTSLNNALAEDPLQQQFALSLLLLLPEKHRLAFVSCRHNPLWHIPRGGKKVSSLSTPNPPLGASLSSPLLETAEHWHPGDVLILRTEGIGDSARFDGAPPQPSQSLAEKILAHADPGSRPGAVIVLHRLF